MNLSHKRGYLIYMVIHNHKREHGECTYLKKSFRQQSLPSLEKHFSVRLHLHSQHWTHFACQDLSSTFKRNLSRIGRSQPAQRTIFMSSVVRSRGRAPRPLHDPRVSTLADLIPGGSYERPSSPTESNSKGRILEKVGSMRVLVFASLLETY